jgi:hypothetical protein
MVSNLLCKRRWLSPKGEVGGFKSPVSKPNGFDPPSFSKRA